jgi:hypothetical protein
LKHVVALFLSFVYTVHAIISSKPKHKKRLKGKGGGKGREGEREKESERITSQDLA